MQALTERGRVLAALGRPADAHLDMTSALDLLETLRTRLTPADFLKRGHADAHRDVFGTVVALLAAEGRHGEAVAAAERARARAFADLLASRRAREHDEAEAAAGRWHLGAPTPATSATPPDSPRMVPALDVAGLAGLARRADTTLLLFWTHEAGSFAWVVGPDASVHGARLQASPAALARLIDQATTASWSGASAGADARRLYARLYQMIVGPVEAWLPQAPAARVTVVPHGPLFRLAFSALRDGSGRYLLERYTLTYAASGAVLDHALGIPPADADVRSALLVADPRPLARSPTGRAQPPLPGARAEVARIASLPRLLPSILTGERASEPAVRRAMPGTAILHFATHAVVRDQDPFGSHLVLGAVPEESVAGDADGRLSASEVAAMDLQADLVVLGACRSARGSISSDGIAGLTRAFLGAGSATVVAALWDVGDESTARLMPAFYRAYLAGEPKDQALRAAQLRLLAELRAGRVRASTAAGSIVLAEHPRHWAAFVLAGAP